MALRRRGSILDFASPVVHSHATVHWQRPDDGQSFCVAFGIDGGDLPFLFFLSHPLSFWKF